VTNTNWQAYGDETTMSLFTQMVGLTVQNALSAATGIAVLFALARGFTQRESDTIGNFRVDLVRSTVHILLPLALLIAIVFVCLGVVQTLSSAVHVTTFEGADQTVALGPVASQLANKPLGTNGGGFFNANSSHPFENSTALSNFLEMFAIFLVPAALCFALGGLVKDRRQGIALCAAMAVIFVPLTFGIVAAEQTGNPALHDVNQSASEAQPGGNTERKEVRFGVTGSAVAWRTTVDSALDGQYGPWATI